MESREWGESTSLRSVVSGDGIGLLMCAWTWKDDQKSCRWVSSFFLEVEPRVQDSQGCCTRSRILAERLLRNLEVGKTLLRNGKSVHLGDFRHRRTQRTQPVPDGGLHLHIGGEQISEQGGILQPKQDSQKPADNTGGLSAFKWVPSPVWLRRHPELRGRDDRDAPGQQHRPAPLNSTSFAAIVSIPVAARRVSGDTIARSGAESRGRMLSSSLSMPDCCHLGKKHIILLEPPSPISCDATRGRECHGF